MSDFFERRVEKVSKKSILFLLVTFCFLMVMLLIQVVFIFILKGDHRYTWMLFNIDASNLALWIISGFILLADIAMLSYIIYFLIKKFRNPFIYKSNLYIIIWVVLIFVLNILIPNLIPINYLFPVIAVVIGSTSMVLI